MNKTVRKKLTDFYEYNNNNRIVFSCSDDTMLLFQQERKLLKEAARDLLSPRTEAISRLLELSRSM